MEQQQRDERGRSARCSRREVEPRATAFIIPGPGAHKRNARKQSSASINLEQVQCHDLDRPGQLGHPIAFADPLTPAPSEPAGADALHKWRALSGACSSVPLSAT